MPMSPGARKVYHYSGYAYPVALIGLGVALPVISLIKQDALDDALMFGGIGLVLVAVGGFMVWRHSRQNPQTPIQTVDDLPPAEGARQTRNAMLIIAVVSILVSALMVYQLAQLEFGTARSVTVWAPVAMMYDFFGFWPAVLFVPALGLLALFSMARKLRSITEGQTRRV